MSPFSFPSSLYLQSCNVQRNCSEDVSGHFYMHTKHGLNSRSPRYLYERSHVSGIYTQLRAYAMFWSLMGYSFHIGAPEDYDEWAQLQKGQPGAEQWAFNEFNK